jgi:hypothetical protein
LARGVRLLDHRPRMLAGKLHRFQSMTNVRNARARDLCDDARNKRDGSIPRTRAIRREAIATALNNHKFVRRIIFMVLKDCISS